MKKIISLLAVLVCCLAMATPAQAQLLKFGVKGGLNMTELDLKGYDSDNTAGFFIGPMVEATIPLVGLGVDGALLYSQTGMSFKEDGKDETLKSHSIEIPINLKYSIGLGKLASVYAAAGPQFAFALSQDKWKDDLTNYTSKPFKKSQLSLNLGVGVKLLGHLQAGATYNIPLGDTAEFDGFDITDVNDQYEAVSSAIGAKNKTWKIHVAYIF